MRNGTPRPRPFLWGVATSAYQSEGGYNGPDQPQTNWAAAERKGSVACLGNASEFWTRFESDFALCQGLGLNAFRLSIEWSRVQPSFHDQVSPAPPFDYAALDHYAEMLAHCRRAGLEPIVTLHHFVHPAWLGPDAWLAPETPELFQRYVAETVRYLNCKLTECHGLPPIHYYITVNEPNMLVLNTYLGTQFPSGAGSSLTNVGAALSHLLLAHVLAYNCVHDTYEEQGWATPAVTLNNHCCDVYWADKLCLDLLALRRAGIGRDDVDGYLQEQAKRFARAFTAARVPLHKDLPYYIGTGFKHWSNAAGQRVFNRQSLAVLLQAIYDSPRPRLLDYVALDYYDPFAAHLFRLPVWWDHEFKNKSLRSWMLNSVTSKWWDWRVLPRGLQFFCEHYHAEYKLPILIAENGMALRRQCGQPHARRRDGMTRSEFLRLHFHEAERIRKRGVPLIGYLHWSLFDNYEWGTYTPRFGLFSIDFDVGADRLDESPGGDRPAETYAQLIAQSRATEKERVGAIRRRFGVSDGLLRPG